MEKVSIFGVNYSVCDYHTAADAIIFSAQKNESFGVSALAVHGLIECVKDNHLREQVNLLDMVVPDGQPVKWAMNYFHKTKLNDTVRGYGLTLSVLEKANKSGLRLYLFGSKENTLAEFSSFLKQNYPNIIIVGTHPDRFREATIEEDLQDIQKINDSAANIVLVGRGCPRQERWVATHLGKINAPMIAIGAVFDFCGGKLEMAPPWMQRRGLEWLYRFYKEPKRLWRRYLITNSVFIYLFIKESLNNLYEKIISIRIFRSCRE